MSLADDYVSLKDQGRNYKNKSTGKIISKRQYDKLRRGGISNEVYKDIRAGKEFRSVKELTTDYYKQWYLDYPKAKEQLTMKEAAKRMKGIKKRLNSDNVKIRETARAQLSTRDERLRRYAELRSKNK